jgi:hypothetical protein
MQINGLLLQNILQITSSQPEFVVRNSRDGTHFGIGLFGWENSESTLAALPGRFQIG